MNDMSQVIVAKSDQINADTLLAGDMTVTIKDVHIRGGQEQPVSIELVETPLFYRPCKSMSRILVAAWGPDAKVYVGRSLRLYRDPTVKWGGLEVGGIRISHMSHIDKAMTMALTATKGSRKPYTVQPLTAEVKNIAAGRQTPEQWARSQIEAAAACPDTAALDALIAKGAKAMDKLEREHPALHTEVSEAYDARRDYFADQDGEEEDDPFAPNDGTLSDDNPTAAEGPADEDRGEPPVWEAKAQSFRELIAEAPTTARLKAIDGDWLKHRAAMPDDVATEIDGLIAAKRRELSGEG